MSDFCRRFAPAPLLLPALLALALGVISVTKFLSIRPAPVLLSQA